MAAGAVSGTQKELEKPVADHLPKVDPATQETRLRYWQEVLQKLNEVPRAQLSPASRSTTMCIGRRSRIYRRPEIPRFEMPANSDSAFWSDLAKPRDGPFKTLKDYRNWIAQMRDIPRYFREQIANMRAGLETRLHPAPPDFAGPRKIHRHRCQGKPKTTCSIRRSRADGGRASRPIRTS